MQITDQPCKPTHNRDVQRTILQQSIDDIADEIGMALRDAGLRFPVYITVPNSGESLASIATPLDPSNNDWERAMALAREVIGRRVGVERLRSRELICAVANTARISASELADDGLPRDSSQ